MKHVESETDMKALGANIGAVLRGGEVIELIGDVGAGKTTFTKGLGRGLQIDEDIQSPSFTLSREYLARDGLELHHYDFYRLTDAGVVAFELAESIANRRAITVIEWAETVSDVLPGERIVIRLHYSQEIERREYSAEVPDKFEYLKELFS